MYDRAMRARLAIQVVGTVDLDQQGQVQAHGWNFRMPDVPPGVVFDVEPIDGTLAGWNAVELHAIAHGVPCNCSIGQAHERDGLLD